MGVDKQLFLSIDKKKALSWKEQKAWHQTDEYFEVLHDVDLESQRCYFCDFPDGKFLELHHVDGDHSNYELNNLRPICSLCHRTIHAGWAAVSNVAKLSILNRPRENFADELDLAVLNQIQRFFMIYKTLPQEGLLSIGRSSLYTAYEEFASFLDKVRSGEELDKGKVGVEDVLTFRRDFHLAYVFEALIRTEREYLEKQAKDYRAQNMAELFYLQQEISRGKLALVFNKNVFRPYDDRCGYTYEERIGHYQTHKLLNPYVISQYIQNGVEEAYATMLNDINKGDKELKQANQKTDDTEGEVKSFQDMNQDQTSGD